MATIKATGIIEEIEKSKKFNQTTRYQGLRIKLDNAGGAFFFYILEYSDQPKPFKLITKHFGEHGAFKVGDKINFDYKEISNAVGMKRRIDSIYNRT